MLLIAVFRVFFFFFFSSRRRHTRLTCDWSSDVCSSDLKAGHRPMVVGDGINDTLALRAGAVGVAMGAQGSGDVALASADLALMTNDLRQIGRASCRERV